MSAPDNLYSFDWWLWAARVDADAAEYLLSNPDLSPHTAAFHCQQAAEKALKGALVRIGIEFPFTHNLESLLALIPEDWELHHRAREISDLSEYSSPANHPGNMVLPTVNDVWAALDTARFTIQAVEKEQHLRSKQ
jgi:hypothetical protein